MYIIHVIMDIKEEIIDVGEPLPERKSFFIEPPKQALWKQIIYLVVGLLLFQGLGTIFALIAKVLIENGSMDAIAGAAFTNFTAYAVEFVIIIGLTIGDYKKIFENFKSWKPYVFGIAGLIAILSINAIYSTILTMAGVEFGDNQNEEAVNSIVTSYPVLSLFIFGIVGPLCEEFTYRAGLFASLKRLNKVVAYIVTIIVFTFIHFDFESFVTGTWANELLNVPLYVTAAFTFTFLFDKFGFAASITSHVANNLLSLLAALARTLLPQ